MSETNKTENTLNAPSNMQTTNETVCISEQAPEETVSPTAHTMSARTTAATDSDADSYSDAPFSYRFSEHERASLADGTLEYVQTDFVLPGRNGFDLSITRSYSSADACRYEMTAQPYSEETRMRTLRRENTHNRLQYGLGLGWKFQLPSIETVPLSERLENVSYSDHLRLADGRSFELKEADGVLQFKDYPLCDVTINRVEEPAAIHHSALNEKTAVYDIAVNYHNGSSDYFKAVPNRDELHHYTLTARKDRFGNCIFFDMQPYGGMRITDSWGREIELAK